MGVPKGTDNFKGYRTGKQEATLLLLKNELEKARRRKMRYPDLSTLVGDMADRTKIHRITLKRNPLYLRELLTFLAGQAGGSHLVADKDAPAELLRAKLIDSQMEIGQLRGDVAAAQARETQALQVKTKKDGDAAFHVAFSDTVWVLRAVLDRLNAEGEIFKVDMERCELLDVSAVPGRQVFMSGKRLRPYIDALRKLLEQEK